MVGILNYMILEVLLTIEMGRMASLMMLMTMMGNPSCTSLL